MKATNIYNQITEAIVKQLEAGIVPWHKPWIGGTHAGCISHTNGHPYSELNQMLLGWRAGEWLTYNQIQAEGGRVKKGEKSSLVVFWRWVQKVEKVAVCDNNGDQLDGAQGVRDEIVGTYPILKGYQVFHIDQTEGIKPKYENKPVEFEHTPVEQAEQVIEQYVARESLKLNICNSDRAFYSPIGDYVQVPERAQYKESEEYYSTLFHELTHSTGHAKRLAREGIVGICFHGDMTYAKEELVAELGAAFMCNNLGIDSAKAFNNSAAYIQSWLRALKNDTKMIVSAAAKAEKAVKFILTGEKQ